MRTVIGIFTLALILFSTCPVSFAQKIAGQKLVINTMEPKVLLVDPMRPSCFVDIQPAIDAANPGDSILVAPHHTYNGFTLDKGVHIRTQSKTFTVNGYITIENILEDARATIMGFVQTESPASGMTIRNCLGEINIEDFELPACLHIEDSNDVLADLGRVTANTGFGVVVLRSTLSMSEAIIQGGVHAMDSMLTLAGPQIVGATGVACQAQSQPAAPALSAINTTVYILGTEKHSLTGGALTTCVGITPYAAAALQLESGSQATIAKVKLEGAKLSWQTEKSLTHNDLIPYLTGSKDVRLGEDVSTILNGTAAGDVIVIFANYGTQMKLGAFVGPNWSVSDRGNYCIMPDVTDANGKMVMNFTVPENFAYIGVPVRTQAGLFLPTGEKLLSNAIVRTLNLP